MQTPVGIDLGTTFSVVACYKNNSVEIISDQYRKRLIPSLVYYDENSGEVSVGHLAYENSCRNPQNLIRDAKRFIGRKASDDLINNSPHRFQLTTTDSGMVAFQVLVAGVSKIITPEEVSAAILKYLVKCASEYLGECVDTAVISVPAYFSGSQRKATLKAAEIAGLKVSKLISEPVAGALHYASDKISSTKLLVVDFGGGTLDVSLIDVKNQIFEVKAVSGDTMLGGRDIDERIFKHFYQPAENVNRFVARSIRRLLAECITLKEHLSLTESFNKFLDYYDGNTDLELELNRQKFNELNCDIFQRVLDIVKFCLADANWKKDDVQEVILVGGSTRIPKIRTLMKDFLGERKIKTNVDPDEAVAGGACLQAAILSRRYSRFYWCKVHEISSFSLGFATYGNLTQVVIPKNSLLPVEKSVSGESSKNNQKTAEFRITEGERKNSRLNNILGTLTINDLPQGVAGSIKFNVKYYLDENGVLTVSATEESTGQKKNLTITVGEYQLGNYQVLFNNELEAGEDENKFEQFISRRNEIIRQCNLCEYSTKNDDLARKCREFVDYAENLKYNLLKELNSRYEPLEQEINKEKSYCIIL